MEGASGLLRRTAAASIAVIAVLVALPAAQAGPASYAGADRSAPRVLGVVLVQPTSSTAAVQVRLSAPLPGARTASVRLAGQSRTWACRPHGPATVLRCPVSGVPVAEPVRVEVQT
jgi:hypothetical protein